MVTVGSSKVDTEHFNLLEEWGDTPTECGFGSSEAWQKVYGGVYLRSLRYYWVTVSYFLIIVRVM